MPSTAQCGTFKNVEPLFVGHPCFQEVSQLVSTSVDLAEKFAEMCGCLREALVAMDKGAHIQVLGRFSEALFKNAFGSSPQLTTACTLLKKAFLEPPATQQQGGKKQLSVLLVCAIGITKLWPQMLKQFVPILRAIKLGGPNQHLLM